MESNGFTYNPGDGDPLVEAARAGHLIDFQVLSLAIGYRVDVRSELLDQMRALRKQKEKMLQDAKLKRHAGAR